MRFGAHHEWGALREAVVGVAPADDADAGRQVEALAERLAREGVTVHRPERRPDARPDLLQLFPRDPAIVAGDHLVEASLRLAARRAERFGLRPILRRLAEQRGARWVAVPPGDPNEVDGPYLEGGDVLLNGREVYVGMSGRASDLAGADWLQALLGERHRVIAVAMRSSVRHLEDCLALLAPGLLAWCPERLVDGLPMALRGWDKIALPGDEADALATHALVLEPGRVVVARGNARLGDELRRRGIDVIPLPFDAVVRWGGGLRSAHQPLLRESAPG